MPHILCLIFKVGKYSSSAKESGICNASQQSPKTSLGVFTGHWEQMPSLQVKIHSTARTYVHKMLCSIEHCISPVLFWHYSQWNSQVNLDELNPFWVESKKTVQICYFAGICNTQKCMEMMFIVKEGQKFCFKANKQVSARIQLGDFVCLSVLTILARFYPCVNFPF